MTLRHRLALIWIVVTLTVAGINAFRMVSKAIEDGRTADAAAAVDDSNAPLEPPTREAELLGKFTIALGGLRAYGPVGDGSEILLNAQPLVDDAAPTTHRLGYAVLVGEVTGWDEGAEFAREIEAESPSASARALASRVAAAMEVRATDPSAVPSAEACAELEDALGYFGRVLCGGGKAESTRAILGVAGAGLWYGLGAFLGLGALLWILVSLFGASRLGRLRPSEDGAHAVLLGETFVVWLALFYALNLGGGFLVQMAADRLGADPGTTGASISLAFGFVAFFLSLAALGYPILRGMQPAELMRLCGLSRGAGYMREILAGVVCYFSAVPLLMGGFALFFLMNWISQQVFGPSDSPSHPAADMIGGASGLQLVLLFAVASIAAPIVEEIVFRGVLYGHMRSVVTPRIRWLSILASAVVSSAVFAAVHPQGLLFTPVLGGLATGFALSRELRESLIAPMVAHAIANAVTLTIGISIMA
jgi:membrane protease YdiL (CAAX protease family)